MPDSAPGTADVSFTPAGRRGTFPAGTTVLEAAAAMLGEGVHRGELTAVLQAQQDALRDSELRWQNLALMLEQVAHRAPLQDTLELLARTLQEQTGVRCAVLVQHPGRSPLLVAPGLAHVARALEDVLL